MRTKYIFLESDANGRLTAMPYQMRLNGNPVCVTRRVMKEHNGELYDPTMQPRCVYATDMTQESLHGSETVNVVGILKPVFTDKEMSVAYNKYATKVDKLSKILERFSKGPVKYEFQNTTRYGTRNSQLIEMIYPGHTSEQSKVFLDKYLSVIYVFDMLLKQFRAYTLDDCLKFKFPKS